MGKLLSLLAVWLFSFYVATALVPKSPGWWPIKYESWKRYATVSTRTEFRKGTEWHWYIDTLKIQPPEGSEVDGWFIGWALVFGLMLYYWEVYCYPYVNLYR